MQARFMHSKARLLRTVAALALLLVPHPANAETLKAALAAAYQTSPVLNAGRAKLRATDEELAKAQSGYRPSIDVNGDWGIAGQATSPKANDAGLRRNDGPTRPKGFSVVLSQPLFQGFRTDNAVKEADASIMAGRANLLDSEQRLLFETTRVYLDVLRDSAIVNLYQDSLRLFSREARATQERFAVGDLTRTDVSQTKARVAQSEGALELAKATLRNSLAEYERLVGHVPKTLSEPAGFEKDLPRSLQEAVDAAVTAHPTIIAAAYEEKAAQHEVNRILGEMLPDVRLQAAHNERFEPTPHISQQINNSLSARVNVPIYQSGEVEARVRQAKETRQGRLQEVEAARVKARSQAIGLYAQVDAQRAQVAAVRRQVAAFRESLAGVREEQKAGARTLLDVLNAEQDMVNAKVAAVRARHDLVLASHAMLQAMGRLTAADLGLDVQLYDVERHYEATNRRWGGISIEHETEVGAWTAAAIAERPVAGWAANSARSVAAPAEPDPVLGGAVKPRR